MSNLCRFPIVQRALSKLVLLSSDSRAEVSDGIEYVQVDSKHSSLHICLNLLRFGTVQ